MKLFCSILTTPVQKVLHNASFETWSAFVHSVVVFIIGNVGPAVGAKDSGNDAGWSNVVAVNTVWYMWHYRSRLRACPRGTQQTDLSEIQTTLGMLCNLFLILRLRSRPPPPMSSSNATRMFLRHWFFGSCDWIKLWFLFNLIGAQVWRVWDNREMAALYITRTFAFHGTCWAASVQGCFPWSSVLMMRSEA